MSAKEYDNIIDKCHFEDYFLPMLGLYMHRFYCLINYGFGFAYRMLKTQKQNTLHGNESFEDCSINQ